MNGEGERFSLSWRRNAKAGAGAALIMGRRKIDGRQKRPRLWEPRIELSGSVYLQNKGSVFLLCVCDEHSWPPDALNDHI